MGLVRKFNFFRCVSRINLLHQLIYRRNRSVGLFHLNNIVAGYIVVISSFFPKFTSALNSINSSYIFGCIGDIDPNCLRCGLKHKMCTKCPTLIVADTRRCVNKCPNGYTESWSSSSDFMGRVCQPVNVSSSVITVFIGVAVGIITCILILALALLIYRRFQRQKSKRNALMHEEISRHEFLQQLDELRPQSEYFLQMLNDTRRTCRKLHLAGDPKAATYNPMISDLAKILILLNKPVQLISNPPQDWYRLYTWAERLDCYKPQIEQLIEFLQSPSITDTRLSSSQHFTFKSHLPTSTNAPFNSQAQHLLQSLISLHELEEEFTENNPQLNIESNEEAFGDTFEHVRNYLSSSPKRNSSIWLEDEFYRLGQRPQDELTTEL